MTTKASQLSNEKSVMMDPFNIFIVEDDQWYSEVLEYLLKMNPDYQVETFTSGKDCIENLYKNPSLITLDYSLDDMNGQEVLRKIKEHNPNIEVVVVSGQDDLSTAVSLLREGAYDYIVKDDQVKDRLWNVVSNIRENQISKKDQVEIPETIDCDKAFKSLIGVCPLMEKVKARMNKALKTSITVSIKGETGTGKEVVAKCIHKESSQSSKPFVAVNVAAIPNELIESELFGHEKGAFTGAISTRKGKFEEAIGGTLFLDEIGDMDLSMQTKLLRALQEREIVRVGGNKVIKFETRIIVATHKNLAEEVQEGKFREDLYYRILGLPIELPPLRERGKDIALLAKSFLKEFANDNNMGKIRFSDEALSRLQEYSYPGNVRELRAIIQLATVMCSDGVIEVDDISFNSSNSMSGFMSNEKSLREYTAHIIKHYLEKYDNNVLLVAKKLDIGKSTIYRMIQSNEV